MRYIYINIYFDSPHVTTDVQLESRCYVRCLPRWIRNYRLGLENDKEKKKKIAGKLGPGELSFPSRGRKLTEQGSRCRLTN